MPATLSGARFMFAGALVCLSALWSADADPASPFAHADKKKLTERFEAAFPEHKVVRSRFAVGAYSLPLLMVEFTPRKPGFYIVRYDVSAKKLKPTDPQEDVTYEFYISVGKKNARRVLAGNRGGWPTALMGDTVVIPIMVSTRFTGHRFSSVSVNKNARAVYAETHRENASPDRKRPASAWKPDISALAKALKLDYSNHQSSRTRFGGSIHRSFYATFEALQPGEFTMSSQVKGKTIRTLSPLILKIVEKGKPLTVFPQSPSIISRRTREGRTVTVTGGTSWAGAIPENMLRTEARVGDLISFHVWGDRYPVAKPAALPKVKLVRKPYAKPKSPYKLSR